nr:TetR/AcrR family transcriptional regulator [Exiguobacterium qingdaonense]
MGVKDRKLRERNQKKELILSAAKEIIEEVGIENLSIRKIANRIEHSPAIIYHYFQDKNEIVDSLLEEGYKRIVLALESLGPQDSTPEQILKESLMNYIEVALAMSEEYKIVMLSDSHVVLKHTSVLFKGASLERPAIQMLCKLLKNSYCENCSDDYVEIVAQIVWSSMFGLITRLILEGHKDKQFKQSIVEHHIDFIINSLKSMKNNGLGDAFYEI